MTSSRCQGSHVEVSARSRNGGLLLFKLSMTIAILYWVFSKIPISKVANSISLAKPLFIAGALAITIPTTIISAGRLKLLTDRQGMSLSLAQITKVNFVTSFYGLFLPGYLASGAIRWHRLSRDGGKKIEALAAVVFSRVMYTITWMIMAIVFLSVDMKQGASGIKTSLLLAMLFSLIMVYGIGFTCKLLHDANQSSDRNEESISGWLSRKINKLFLAASAYNHLSTKSWVLLVALTVLESLLEIFSVQLLALAIDIDICYINLGWVISVLKLVTLLPISISGLGIREGGLIVLLGPYGVLGSEAVALSFLIFAKIVFVGGIGAIVDARDFWHPASAGDMKT